MRRVFYWALVMSLALSACATASSTPAVVLAPTDTSPAATAAPKPSDPAATEPVIKTEFTPTDPATVNLAAGKPQLVEFFAFWWITCNQMKPIVHGLEARYGDRIGFVYLDIDDPNTADIKTALGYRVQPNFFLVDGDGNIVKQWLGFVSEAEFESAFQSVLQ